jgi:hypothetical protein
MSGRIATTLPGSKRRPLVCTVVSSWVCVGSTSIWLPVESPPAASRRCRPCRLHLRAQDGQEPTVHCPRRRDGGCSAGASGPPGGRAGGDWVGLPGFGIRLHASGRLADPSPSVLGLVQAARPKDWTAEDQAPDVRHSYASAALAAGIAAKVVSERLGHATIAITMGHVQPRLTRPGRASRGNGGAVDSRRRRVGERVR